MLDRSHAATTRFLPPFLGLIQRLVSRKQQLLQTDFLLGRLGTHADTDSNRRFRTRHQWYLLRNSTLEEEIRRLKLIGKVTMLRIAITVSEVPYITISSGRPVLPERC